MLKIKLNRILIFVLFFILSNNKNIHSNIPHVFIPQKNKLYILFFYSTTCPLCKYYTKEVNTIANTYKQTAYSIIIFSGAYKRNEIKQYQNLFFNNYVYLIRDKKYKCSVKYSAIVTPQVILIRNDTIFYSGLIDDSFNNITYKNNNPSKFYLINAIDNLILNKKIIPSYTTPIGCLITSEF